MSLTTDLAAFRAEFMGAAPPDIRDAMHRADLELAASGIADTALRAGDAAPDFALPGIGGRTTQLSILLRNGPVVVSFYRGGWCPYCNLELRALQAVLPQLHALGAELVAISPQTPDESISTSEQDALAFPVLSDAGSLAARRFGIAFVLADALRPIYARFGHALPARNGDDSWMLPVPATYVIGPDGRIVLAYVDVDYRNRLDPSDIVAAVRQITGHAAG